MGSYVVSSAKRQSLSFAYNLNISTIMSKQKRTYLTNEEVQAVWAEWDRIAKLLTAKEEERRIAA